MRSNSAVRGACVTLALAGLLATGCSSGGGGGKGVASLGVGSGSASHKSGGSSRADPLKYSQCMRAHGVTKFPDPGPNGELRIAAGPGTGLDPSSATFRAAQQACKSLEPTPPAADRKKMYDALLKFAQCMRQHGIAKFPDPNPDGGLRINSRKGDSLDPNGLGRLINNAADDLHGQGATLNHALDQVSQLVSTFAAKDQQLADIVDNFDKFTAALETRETQLGDVLATFSQATQVLADERQGIENLLAGLANLSTNGLQLVSKHADALRTDLDTLTQLAQSIDSNLDGLAKLLDSGPTLVQGILGAYNPTARAVNLRQNWGPLVESVLGPVVKGVLPGATVPTPCVPGVQSCDPPLTGQSVGPAATVQLGSAPIASTPIDDLLGLLSGPTGPRPPAPSTADRVASGATGVGGFLHDALAALVGAS